MKRNSSSPMDSSRRNPNCPSSSSGAAGGGPSMQITSDEVNFLIFRYLQEAGFVHSAFTFINESMISRSNISRSDIPPGALISFLQKGLQYVGIEETIRQDGSDRLLLREKQGKTSKNSATTGNDANTNGTSDNEIIDFGLLSPHVIKALIRRDAPIKLNVPPEAAAAAIRAKIEAESKVMKEQGKQGQKMMQPTHSHSRPSQTNGPIGSSSTTAQHPTNPPQTNNSTSTRQKANQNIHKSPSATKTMSDKTRSSAASQDSNHTVQQQAARAKTTMNQQKISPNATNVTSNGYETKSSSSSTTTGEQHAKAAAAQALASVAQIAAHNNDVVMAGSTSNNNHNTTQNPQSYNTATNDAAQVLASNMQLNQDNNSNNALTPQQEMELEKDDQLTRARPDEVMELNKHSSEVFMCAWNPIFTNLLATGSGDASARIWEMGSTSGNSSKNAQSRFLAHGNNSSDKKNKDVTTLEWSSDGELLATGSYDGVARVWRKDGSIVHTLSGHMGPIFSLKWNKGGNYLLSGSYDKTTIVWDVWEKKGAVKQQFHNHTAPALDVDWRDDETFASCSTDKSVLICKVGQTEPLFQLIGHKDEVNAVKWDPSGTLLASCSDDHTAKVWNVSSGSSQPLHDFKSHKQEIYTVKWSPTGPGSKNSDKPLMLATASFDGSVRLWDVKDGSCISILSRHRDSVYSVSFSPSGEYLASGSLAGQLYIWRVRDGQQVKNFKGKGDIFEVAWNVEETRVAACFSSNVVNVIDFRP